MFEEAPIRHLTLGVLIPEIPGAPINEFRVDEGIVYMWSINLIPDQVIEKMQRQAPDCPELSYCTAYETILKERRGIMIHEMAHSVGDKLLKNPAGGWNALGQKWLDIAWESTSKPKGAPFSCKGVDFGFLRKQGHCGIGPRTSPGDLIFQANGFVSQYAGTNPDEDFAESVAHVLAGSSEIVVGKTHEKITKKIEFVKALFK